MADAPLVSIVMPVYNGEKYLGAAVESILNQTFRDFEFLIINDGSTDKTGEILQGYTDPRIKIINNGRNIGLVESLNIGLEIASGRYIARMDADDVSLPDRLLKQVEFLNSHQEIGIMGSDYYQVACPGQKGNLFCAPGSDLQIRWAILLGSPFGHPTVMLRRDVLMAHKLCYNDSFPFVEDYELWTRVLDVTQSANLRKPLLLYRMHKESVSGINREAQLAKHDEIALRTIQKQLPEISINLSQVSRLRDLFVTGERPLAEFREQLLELSVLYLDMLTIFVKHHFRDPGINKLRRTESLKTLRLILRSRNQPGWSRVFRRMLAIDPAIPFLLPGYLLIVIVRHIKHRMDISDRVNVKFVD